MIPDESTGAKFTPGPWEVARIPQFVRNSGLSIKTVYGSPGMDESELMLATITCGVNAEANSRLIAAAPDLYAALKDIWERWGMVDWTSVHDAAQMDAARAALLKAEGGVS